MCCKYCRDNNVYEFFILYILMNVCLYKVFEKFIIFVFVLYIFIFCVEVEKYFKEIFGRFLVDINNVNGVSVFC